MPSPARFKDLCIDVDDVERAESFWSAALGLAAAAEDRARLGRLTGEVGEQTVWLNQVPEPHTVKNRVHLDVHCASIAELEAMGARRLSAPGEFAWTVMADPEGQEFCAFVREQPLDYRLYEISVDCRDPSSLAAWWADVWGGTTGADDAEGYTWVGEIPGAPFAAMTFSPVPEPKTVKNRVHWDVTVADRAGLDALIAAGARVLRPVDDEIDWDVLADPEGNEFCAFRADRP